LETWDQEEKVRHLYSIQKEVIGKKNSFFMTEGNYAYKVK